MNATIITLLTSLAVTGPATGGDPLPVSQQATIDLCIVSAIKDIDVAAQEAGRLTSVLVEEDATVQANVLLAQIDDRQAQLDKYNAILRRNAALARAQSDVDVKIAEATHGVAQAELEQRQKTNHAGGNIFTKSEIRKLELARDRAKYEIEKSKLDLQIAKMTADSEEANVRAAENNIVRRQIASPIDGKVVSVLRQAGEWVNAGDAVLRVVQMDRLRVEGRLSSRDFNPGEIDQRPVIVEVELARGRVVQFRGHVVSVSPIVKAGSIYRVRAEVENRQEAGHWLLRPGATGSMTIRLK